MKTFASTLGSRGWALLVLSGGVVLAAPFFKGSDAKKPQYTSIDSPTHPIKQLNSARSDTLARALNSSPPLPSTSSSLSSLPNTTATLGTPSSKAVDLSTSTRPQSAAAGPNQNSALSDNTSVALAPVPRASIDSSAIVVQPPAAQISTPSVNSQILAGAAPLNSELPAWARKPSMSDTLISSSSSRSSAEQADIGLPPAKKPSAYRAWTDDLNAAQPVETAAASDRSSPFGGQNSENVPRNHSNSVVRWPDEDPRTVVVAPKAEKIVGRDAIIRDPNILQGLTEQPGRTAVHASNDPKQVEFRTEASNLVVQPKFGQASVGSSSISQPLRPTLRSKVPPDERQFIRQPFQ